MRIRFQADADLNQRIVRAVRRGQPAIDFQTADEAQIRSLNDPEVLVTAAAEGRIVVTHDRTTMGSLRHFHRQARQPRCVCALTVLAAQVSNRGINNDLGSI